MDIKIELKAYWLPMVNIRRLVKTDLPELEWGGEYRHFRNIFNDAYNRSQRGLSVLWVAELPDNGLIGQVFIQLTCDRPELADGHFRAYLYSFRVKPEFRSSGLGKRIMEIVESDLLNRGFTYITLNVAKDNPRAQLLYQRLGYRVVAHEPGVWSYVDPDGGWHTVTEPAWRMEKKLQ
jgi:ribosomal protein S18 acetylase RimI-like enzyme